MARLYKVTQKFLTDARTLVFIWPFIFLFPYVMPIFHGKYALIGNDFEYLYYRYKFYLLSGLVHFRFPLWSPAEAAGFPFFANPFSQSFYPLNIPLALFAWIKGSYSIADHQRFTVLGISILGLGLYLWLRELRLSPRAALFACLVMPISFKVVEILRFPNAIHTAAWYPWILFCITKLLKAQTRKAFLGYGALLAFSIMSLLTGGYFYYVYYSAFLFLPYLAVMLIPGLRASFIEGATVKVGKALLAVIISGALTLVLCAPYVVKVLGLLSQTTDRSGANFEYSTQFIFTGEDTLGSLVYPPAAQPEGWYFFGILGVLLILVFLVSDEKESGIGLPGKFAFGLWFTVITYITYQRDSFLFRLLWEYLPGFSSLRVWGRMNIILIPIIAWLLALAYGSFERRVIGLNANENRGRRTLSIALIFAYLGILAVQFHFVYFKILDPYWKINVQKVVLLNKLLNMDLLSPTLVFLMFGALSFAFLLALILLGRTRLAQLRWAPAGLLIGMVLFSTLELSNIGPFSWLRGWEEEKPSVLIDLDAVTRSGYENNRTRIYTTLPLFESDNTGIVLNWYFKRYVDFLAFASAEPGPRDRLLGVSQNRRTYFSTSISYTSIAAYLQDAERFDGYDHLEGYNGDYLSLEVMAPRDGYLSYIDNWDPDWRAFVDGKEQPIELLFGTFKALRLTQGAHQVSFIYSPLSLR